MNILFLGAGRRHTLFSHFLAARQDVRLFSAELSHRVSIAPLATILIAPRFDTLEARTWLHGAVRQHEIDMVIPMLDSATVLLSGEQIGLPCNCAVSSEEICQAMYDKDAGHQWMVDHAIPVPQTAGYPAILKPKYGFGSQGVAVAYDAAIEAKITNGNGYHREAFVKGPEYTVDAYVNRQGEVVCAVSRKRLAVVAGEVNISETHRHAAILAITRTILAEPGWYGPITLQFIDGLDGPVVIDINPRFGGGTTHSIALGMHMPHWLMQEHEGRRVFVEDGWPDGSVMVRAWQDVLL